ncbi:endonuclease/exonuclease/phosphatase family protein [Photobacterium sp. GJ3]|uniref:endonuclease/exonuclease/phosphatase family protein n=1 Tax=Photobacterium sp. GJ3 TaxID=2829502 RepID=UPI001B8C92A5|nr:endonuclease/exonuclease/phosphatase family protein [Photobacterium sp. GJ3]QUJ69132.1 endonuclease/exonuclease/phosphatase family protein [Photobacterium sp. GJ3]
MSDPVPGRIREKLAEPGHLRFSRIAAMIQRIQPDVLLLCEFDHPGEGGDDGSLDDFCRYYLAEPQHGQVAIDYPYRYCPPSNTGLPSPVDLDGDGKLTLPQDAQGFGFHHGHFGFVVLSRYPLIESNIRSWQQFLWQEMPEHLMPEDYYSPEAAQAIRLSSKNHVLIPVQVGPQRFNLLCAHPTPPVFDGPERRNARRNHDELRLLTDIIGNEAYLIDDQGRAGGILPDEAFVLMGDLNADMHDGEGMVLALRHLLYHHRIHRVVSEGKLTPKSLGGRFFRPWKLRRGRSAEWTHLGGLRLDYVLPSSDFDIMNSGVFWPDKKDPLRRLVAGEDGRERAEISSDHRLVWVDVRLPAQPSGL